MKGESRRQLEQMIVTSNDGSVNLTLLFQTYINKNKEQFIFLHLSSLPSSPSSSRCVTHRVCSDELLSKNNPSLMAVTPTPNQRGKFVAKNDFKMVKLLITGF